MVGDDASVSTISKGVATAIADTGTTLMLVNQEIVDSYYAKVEGAQMSVAAGGFIYPCSSTLPDLWVSLGDTHLARIPSSLVNFATVGTDTATNTQRKFLPPFFYFDYGYIPFIYQSILTSLFLIQSASEASNPTKAPACKSGATYSSRQCSLHSTCEAQSFE